MAANVTALATTIAAAGNNGAYMSCSAYPGSSLYSDGATWTPSIGGGYISGQISVFNANLVVTAGDTITLSAGGSDYVLTFSTSTTIASGSIIYLGTDGKIYSDASLDIAYRI